jgi:hypothetical protein
VVLVIHKGEIAEIKECLFILRVAVKILLSQILELESRRKNYHFTCILETGKRYPEAIGLYKKWITILQLIMVNIGNSDSVCFSKSILK